ncbi:MAG: pyridoxine 5'-phosphate synthase [Cryomorphaceae bacterium]|nr:pyridoxine 5'-phosphate synthase [Cryomorphaceae bacterium]
MTKLSVNINKIATLRNARGGNIPNVVKAALDIERFGADGITVHPRPDERHIRYRDVFDLKDVLQTEFNIEGYPSQAFMKMILEVKPTQVTFVPDPPDVLTSNAGWDTIKHADLLRPILQRCKDAGIRTSLFIETEIDKISMAREIGANRVELYTEAFASEYGNDKETAISPYIKAAEYAEKCELEVNAGHDLSLENLRYFSQNIKPLHEVSIGHALISDALYYGLQNIVPMYKRLLE